MIVTPKPGEELAAAQNEMPSRRFVPPTIVVRNHDAVLRFTSQLFPAARISVTQEADPEIENDEYFAILVETPGSVDHVVALHREWHNRIGSIAPETSRCYRLLLDIND